MAGWAWVHSGSGDSTISHIPPQIDMVRWYGQGTEFVCRCVCQELGACDAHCVIAGKIFCIHREGQLPN